MKLIKKEKNKRLLPLQGIQGEYRKYRSGWRRAGMFFLVMGNFSFFVSNNGLGACFVTNT